MSQFECPSSKPSFNDYVYNFGVVEYTLLALSSFLCMCTMIVTIFSIRRTVKNVSGKIRHFTAIIKLIYPLASICSVFTILVPRITFLMDLISIVAFTYFGCLFVGLCNLYVGGERKLVEISEGDDDAFQLRRIPICYCWCLKNSKVTKTKLRNCKYLIYQLAIVLPIVLLIQAALKMEEENLYLDTIYIFLPFTVISILLSVWGFNIYVRLVDRYLPPDNKLVAKYMSLQVVLLFVKFQPFIGELVVALADFDCVSLITPTIVKNNIVNFLITLEMLLLSIASLFLYKVPSDKVVI